MRIWLQQRKVRVGACGGALSQVLDRKAEMVISVATSFLAEVDK